jgi:glycosyltransferase involved in cell wall biosynthesis
MLSDVYFPRVNGVSTSIQIVRRELERRGHEVVLVAPAYPRQPLSTDVVRVPSRGVPLDPEDRALRVAALRRHVAGLAPQRFDLVHVQTPFIAHREGVRIARAFGLPIVETYHTFFEEYLHHYLPLVPRTLTRWVVRAASRRQCNRVDRVIVPSPAMRELLRRYGVATPVAVIPTGLDFDELTRGDGERFRRLHGIAQNRSTLVHVGRMAREKNIDFLLEVVARVRRTVPTVLLVLAGEGPALAGLRQRALELGLEGHVLFVGYLCRERELQDCYRAGDVFVFASRTETQGLVLLEAMALGVPVVSTAAMGTLDIVAPEQGALRAQEDVDEFAAKVARLLAAPARRAELGRQAAAFARRWSAAAMADDLLALYGELVAARRAA